MSGFVLVGIAIAGALGTLLRVALTGLDAQFYRQLYGTLTVNVAGSFLLAVFADQTGDSTVVLGVGGLGALTTFSTFVAHVERLVREESAEKAAAYVLASVILGVTAALIGLAL